MYMYIYQDLCDINLIGLYFLDNMFVCLHVYCLNTDLQWWLLDLGVACRIERLHIPYDICCHLQGTRHPASGQQTFVGKLTDTL